MSTPAICTVRNNTRGRDIKMTNVCLLLMVQFIELNSVYRIQEFNAGLDDARPVNQFLSSCSLCANSNISVHSFV